MMRTFFGMPCRKTARSPLCSLTGDIHLHTLVCPDEARKARVLAALEEKGYLMGLEK
ncbi:3H domain-containing protein [Ruthenibacterium lactatiformans]|jgi:transcriptional regulator of NAD metabolism|uniref:3H domain-containing protein n=1 Tax=Ruthenibacterium lactatiformans TaxID=1550024 RepID=UPI003AB1749E